MKELRCIPVSQDVLDRINAIPIYAPSPLKGKSLTLEEALVLNNLLNKKSMVKC